MNGGLCHHSNAELNASLNDLNTDPTTPTLMQQLDWLREYKAELEETKNALIDQALPFLEKLHQGTQHWSI
jgi:hypothetical protein